MFTMNEDRFNNFKKTIAHKNYGKYWSEAKNTFDIEFKNNSFINRGSRNYFPDIYNPKLNKNDLLDVNLNNNEDKKIFKLGTKNLCLHKKTPSRTLIYSQYCLNSIDKYLNEKDIVFEIGAGSGLFSALINERKRTRNILVDIPEVLLTAISLIFTLFPNKNFLLPNEIEKNSTIDFKKYDFVFLTPDLLHHIKDESINFAINTRSFMEMDMAEVDDYLIFLEKKIINNKINNIYPVNLFVEILKSAKKNNNLIFSDAGATLSWTFQGANNLKNCPPIYSAFNLHAMGYSNCAAIGAKVSNIKKNILCIIGDGSLPMNVQELSWTKKYPIKIIIIDNEGYGIIRQTQQDFYKSVYYGSDFKNKKSSLPKFNIYKILKSYDIPCKSITKYKHLAKSLNWLHKSNYTKALILKINYKARVQS